LPDGSFTDTDALGRAFYERACAPYLERLLAVEDVSGHDRVFGPSTAIGISCARVRGETVEAVQRRVQDEWQALNCSNQLWCTAQELQTILDFAARVPDR
jgi:hypothetical protein